MLLIHFLFFYLTATPLPDHSNPNALKNRKPKHLYPDLTNLFFLM